MIAYDSRYQKCLRLLWDAREHELARTPIRQDLIEFASAVLLEEASGGTIGRLAIGDREMIGELCNRMASKYGNPVIVRSIAALAVAGMPH